MHNNSFNRIKLLWLIEWKNRAKVILGLTVFSMLIMFCTILIAAQKLELSISFFPIHFGIGIFILMGVQVATLFPEWRNMFQSSQYLQTPATTWEKYVSRLSFPFIVAPGIYIAAFLLCRPLCLQFSLMVKDFMPYPMYAYEVRRLIISMILLSIYFFTLFIPGSIWLNRGHFIKSAMLYLGLFLAAALLSALLRLPMYETTKEGISLMDRVFSAQTRGLALFISEYGLIWLGLIVPMMLIAGYYLLKYREV